jgi:N-methylhydantoinase A
LLSAPIEHEVSTALPRPVDGLDLTEVRATLEKLDARCSALMAQESVVHQDVVRRYCADICYAGQAYHLEVLFEPTASDPLAALERAFYAAHDRTYGYAPKAPIRLVNLRTVHSVRRRERQHDAWSPSGGPACVRRAHILLPDRRGVAEADVYDRAALRVGEGFAGPAIIEQEDTTTLVTPDWLCRVDALGNLLLERRGNGGERT